MGRGVLVALLDVPIPIIIPLVQLAPARKQFRLPHLPPLSGGALGSS